MKADAKYRHGGKCLGKKGFYVLPLLLFTSLAAFQVNQRAA